MMSLTTIAQENPVYFPAHQLTTVGAYYYPEHWECNRNGTGI